MTQVWSHCRQSQFTMPPNVMMHHSTAVVSASVAQLLPLQPEAQAIYDLSLKIKSVKDTWERERIRVGQHLNRTFSKGIVCTDPNFFVCCLEVRPRGLSLKRYGRDKSTFYLLTTHGRNSRFSKNVPTYSMHCFLCYRCIMALPFLPAEHAELAFCAMVVMLPDDIDDRLSVLVSYVNDMWISSRLWPASSWSAYEASVRTNNDVEGWHNRLNCQTRNGKLDLYQVAGVLYAAAQYVDVQAVLVGENRLSRYQRRAFCNVQGRLHDYWHRYAAGELTTSQLLRGCSHCIAPKLQTLSFYRLEPSLAAQYAT